MSKKELEKRQHWTDTAGLPITLWEMGRIDRASILAFLISKVGVKMNARYLSVLKRQHVAAILEAGLNATVRSVCQDGKFYLEEYTNLFFSYIKALQRSFFRD